jgi:hypothetical protein
MGQFDVGAVIVNTDPHHWVKAVRPELDPGA